MLCDETRQTDVIGSIIDDISTCISSRDAACFEMKLLSSSSLPRAVLSPALPCPALPFTCTVPLLSSPALLSTMPSKNKKQQDQGKKAEKKKKDQMLQ